MDEQIMNSFFTVNELAILFLTCSCESSILPVKEWSTHGLLNEKDKLSRIDHSPTRPSLLHDLGNLLIILFISFSSILLQWPPGTQKGFFWRATFRSRKLRVFPEYLPEGPRSNLY